MSGDLRDAADEPSPPGEALTGPGTADAADEKRSRKAPGVRVWDSDCADVMIGTERARYSFRVSDGDAPSLRPVKAGGEVAEGAVGRTTMVVLETTTMFASPQSGSPPTLTVSPDIAKRVMRPRKRRPRHPIHPAVLKALPADHECQDATGPGVLKAIGRFAASMKKRLTPEADAYGKDGYMKDGVAAAGDASRIGGGSGSANPLSSSSETLAPLYRRYPSTQYIDCLRRFVQRMKETSVDKGLTPDYGANVRLDRRAKSGVPHGESGLPKLRRLQTALTGGLASMICRALLAIEESRPDDADKEIALAWEKFQVLIFTSTDGHRFQPKGGDPLIVRFEGEEFLFLSPTEGRMTTNALGVFTRMDMAGTAVELSLGDWPQFVLAEQRPRTLYVVEPNSGTCLGMTWDPEWHCASSGFSVAMSQMPQRVYSALEGRADTDELRLIGAASETPSLSLFMGDASKMTRTHDWRICADVANCDRNVSPRRMVLMLSELLKAGLISEFSAALTYTLWFTSKFHFDDRLGKRGLYSSGNPFGIRTATVSSRNPTGIKNNGPLNALFTGPGVMANVYKVVDKPVADRVTEWLLDAWTRVDPTRAIAQLVADGVFAEGVAADSEVRDVLEKAMTLTAADSPDIVLELELRPQLGCDACADGTFVPDEVSHGMKVTRREYAPEDTLLPGEALADRYERLKACRSPEQAREYFSRFHQDAAGGMSIEDQIALLKTEVDAKAQIKDEDGTVLFTADEETISQLTEDDIRVLRSRATFGLYAEGSLPIEALSDVVRDALSVQVDPNLVKAAREEFLRYEGAGRIHRLADAVRAEAIDCHDAQFPTDLAEFTKLTGVTL